MRFMHRYSDNSLMILQMDVIMRHAGGLRGINLSILSHDQAERVQIRHLLNIQHIKNTTYNMTYIKSA